MPDKATGPYPDEFTISESSAQGTVDSAGEDASDDARSKARSSTDSGQHHRSGHDRTAPARRSGFFKPGHTALVVTLTAVLGLVGFFAYNLTILLNPGLESHSFRDRFAAKAAAKHLDNNPHVSSVRLSEEESYDSGSAPTVSVRLKDNTSTDTAAALLSSTRDATFGDEKEKNIQVDVTLEWRVDASDINVVFLMSTIPGDIAASAQDDLAPAGEATTIRRLSDTSPLQVDYGQVTTPPTSLTSRSGSTTEKTFTMDGWKVTSTSNTEGQFTTPPLAQVIVAARQASTTGTMDLNGGTLSVTGLVADERKGLTPEAAAPVVHAVADCNAAGLTTLRLANSVPRDSSDSFEQGPWTTFVCRNGAWVSEYDSPSPSDTAILQKAAEL